MGEWHIAWDRPGAGRQFAAVMEARRQGEQDQQFKPLRRGWCLGSQKFRAETLEYIQQQKGKWHYGKELGESARAKAERLIGEACRAEAVSQEQLRRCAKGPSFQSEASVDVANAHDRHR